MIHLIFDNIEVLTAAHYGAVEDYVATRPAEEQDRLYECIRALVPDLGEHRPEDDYDVWLKRFILADVEQLEYWVANKPQYLKFDFFQKLYRNRFAQNDKYVDRGGTYNAYALLRMMDIQVCPYCDDEYFDILHPAQGLRRSSEFDHFYPKGDEYYPGLAMCFYNLIPSGKTCNQLMNAHPIAANPYHGDIENWSRFESAVPFGANLDSLPLEDFRVNLVKTGRMVQNDATLALEERYNHRQSEIKAMLMAARDLSDDKCEMLINLGVDPVWLENQKRHTLGTPYPTDRGKRLHQKLRHDLTGY